MPYKIFAPRAAESTFSIPNSMTLVRFGACLTFFILAIHKGNPVFNFVGLGIHWVGDTVDGLYARVFKQETVVGAEIDIIADRVEVLAFCLIFLGFNPHLYLPIVIYIIQFAFVDFYLSYQFTKYDIISPNYFYKIDQTVYRLNFTPAMKFCNGVVIPLLLIFLPQVQLVAALLAAVLIGTKSYSISLLRKQHGQLSVPLSRRDRLHRRHDRDLQDFPLSEQATGQVRREGDSLPRDAPAKEAFCTPLLRYLVDGDCDLRGSLPAAAGGTALAVLSLRQPDKTFESLAIALGTAKSCNVLALKAGGRNENTRLHGSVCTGWPDRQFIAAFPQCAHCWARV